MSVEVKVPNLPESVSDATVAKWHKKPGDAVDRDESLVDLETDKVVLEVPAPADGVLKDISAEEGETVTEGQLLGHMEEGEAPAKTEESSDSKGDGGDDEAADDDHPKATTRKNRETRAATTRPTASPKRRARRRRDRTRACLHRPVAWLPRTISTQARSRAAAAAVE